MSCINCSNKKLKIKVYKIDKKLPNFEKFKIGDWIDLRVSNILLYDFYYSKFTPVSWDNNNKINIIKNKYYFFKLGFSCQLPDTYESYILPRSSTFKTWGLLLTNSMGIIDNSYSGKNDEYIAAFYSTKKTSINKYDRVVQFRVQKKMPKLEIEYVNEVDGINRGGFGSTGVK